MSQPFPDFLPHGMGGEMKDRRGKPADPGRYKMPDRNTKHSDENIVRFDGAIVHSDEDIVRLKGYPARLSTV